MNMGIKWVLIIYCLCVINENYYILNHSIAGCLKINIDVTIDFNKYKEFDMYA